MFQQTSPYEQLEEMIALIEAPSFTVISERILDRRVCIDTIQPHGIQTVFRVLDILSRYLHNNGRQSLAESFGRKIHRIWGICPPVNLDTCIQMMNDIRYCKFNIQTYERIIPQLFENSDEWSVTLLDLIAWHLAIFHYVFTEEDTRRILLISRRFAPEDIYIRRFEWAVLNMNPKITASLVANGSIRFLTNYDISNCSEDTFECLMDTVSYQHPSMTQIFTYLVNTSAHHLLIRNKNIYVSALRHYYRNGKKKDYQKLLSYARNPQEVHEHISQG